MNIKLKNLRSAEEDLGKFLGNVVVTSELSNSICGDEVNDTYLEYVIELNNKVTHACSGNSLFMLVAQQCTQALARRLSCREARTPQSVYKLITSEKRFRSHPDQVHRTDSGSLRWIQSGYASIKHHGSERSTSPPRESENEGEGKRVLNI